MLDERKEYLEYTSELLTSRRLLYRKDEVEGIARVFEIIARYALFDEAMQPEQVVELLSLWCGLKSFAEVDEKYMTGKENLFANMDDLFGKYLDMLAEEEKQKKGESNKYTNLIRQRKRLGSKRYLEDPYQINLEGAGYINKIYFANIIADAKVAGPLKTYYLVCNKNPVAGIEKSKASKVKEKVDQKEGLDVIKVAALLCLKMHLKEDKLQEQAVRNKIKLVYPTLNNWMSHTEQFSRWIKKYYYKESALFHISYWDIHREHPKFILDETWIDDKNARVIDKENMLQMIEKDAKRLENNLIYADLGCQAGLTEIKISDL